LARALLAAKAPGFRGWKSLDFLGFSRQNLAFSRGYTGFSLEKNSRALCPRPRRQNGVMADWVMGMRRLIHQGSLAQFVFFVNRSSPDRNSARQFSHQSIQLSRYDSLQMSRRPAISMMHPDALAAPIMQTKEAGIASLQVAANVQSNHRYRQKLETVQHRPCVTHRQFWQGPPHRNVWAWRRRRQRTLAS
jgi:hypothetical protein